MSEDNPSLKKSALHGVAGAVAGTVEVFTSLPLDLVKTRLQMQVAKTEHPDHCGGVIDCLSKMYRNEGFFALWKGIFPALMMKTSKMAVKFLAFEEYKYFFKFESFSLPMTYCMAGIAVGTTEAVLFNFLEVVKVTQQINRARMKHTPSTWSVTRDIIQEHGIGFRGLNRGIGANIANDAGFNAMYFGLYYSVKDYVPDQINPLEEFLTKFALGFTSSSLACVFNIPFDVIKTRLQCAQEHMKYRNTWVALVTVYREEGWKALYKGLVPKLIRIGPGGAIIMLVYDYVNDELQSRMILEDNPSLKKSALHGVAGAVASTVEVCTSLLLDLVKTRLQMQVAKTKHPDHCGGIIDCLSKMYRNEGFFALWKGIFPDFITRRSINFTDFERLRYSLILVLK